MYISPNELEHKILNPFNSQNFFKCSMLGVDKNSYIFYYQTLNS